MTPTNLPLRRFVEGAYFSWEPGAPVPEVGTPVSLSPQQLPELPDPDVEAVFLAWLEEGAYLKALTLLKLLLPADPNGRYLKPLLSHALGIEAPMTAPGLIVEVAPRKDPVPQEFLGAERLELAWSVLERDSLEWAVDCETRTLTGREWTVSRSTESPLGSPEDEAGTQLDEGSTDLADESGAETPGLLLLTWCSTTEVAGKLRPAGERNVARQRAEMQATVALLGADRERFGVQRFESEVRDLSPGGMGVWIADPFKKVDGISLKEHRVRVELISSFQDSKSALADVRWVESDQNEQGAHGWKMGLKFVEPTEEFNETVEELLRPGKGDVQFLWNLWQSNARRA